MQWCQLHLTFDALAHSALPKLLGLVDLTKNKWKRLRLSLRGTDLQFRDIEVCIPQRTE